MRKFIFVLTFFFVASAASAAEVWREKVVTECPLSGNRPAECVLWDRPVTDFPSLADLKQRWEGNDFPLNVRQALASLAKKRAEVTVRARSLGGEVRVAAVQTLDGWHEGLTLHLYIEKEGRFLSKDEWAINAFNL